MRLIDADILEERFCELEVQALIHVGKINERDGDEFSEEWKIWSAILQERTAFKHDVFDSPTIDINKWIPCCERLPEMYERVLISVKEDGHNERIELAFLAQLPVPRKIRFRAIPNWYEIDDVLAWQPLPKPYKKDNE